MSRYLAVPPNVCLRIEDFGCIVFDKLTGTLVELDRDAATMLHYIDNSGSAAEDVIMSRFADQNSAAGVLGRLLDLGILQVVSPRVLPVDRAVSPIPWPSGPQLAAPETVHWAITYRCNQNCPDCYARRHIHSFADELDTTAAAQLVDMLADWGIFQLSIGGGEPLLRPDLAFICEHARQSGLVVHVTTGYHCVSSELLHSLRDTISVLQIGAKHHKLLEGPVAECEKLSNTVRSAHDLGIGVGANLMLSNTVMVHFDELINLIAQAGIKRITLLRYKPPADQSQWILENPSPDKWRDFEQLFCDTIRRYPELIFRVDCALSFLQRGITSDNAQALGIRGCVAGERILALTPDGSAYPCSQLVRPGMRAGNLLIDNPNDLWACSSAMISCRSYRESDKFAQSKCGMCEAKGHCGGCRVFADDGRGCDPGCPESY
ncbi:MAG: radical SAM protein [Armatimonadota bacterium]